MGGVRVNWLCLEITPNGVLEYSNTPKNFRKAKNLMRPPSRGQRQSQVLWAWILYTHNLLLINTHKADRRPIVNFMETYWIIITPQGDALVRQSLWLSKWGIGSPWLAFPGRSILFSDLVNLGSVHNYLLEINPKVPENIGRYSDVRKCNS